MQIEVLRIFLQAFRRYGICRSDFLSITPRELHMLEDDYISEWQQKNEIEERRTGRIVASIYNNNPNRTKSSRFFSEVDFANITKKENQKCDHKEILEKLKKFHTIK